jgi:uncharacterized protein
MSLKKKLLRMKTHLPEEPVREEKESSSGEDKALKALGFTPFYLEECRSYRRKVLYEWEDREMFERMELLRDFWEKNESGHPLSFQHPVENLLFFDTETTGLSTGAGTMIFLIGYARVKKDGIEVTQHFLPGPEQEPAFLGGFLEDFGEEDIIVSYNGKSFDWPQVRSRHAFLRRELPKLPETGHIDLLHAARRFWKEELPSCRLAVVEEKKLGGARTDDTPGSLAPLLYFEYMESNNPAPLKGIMDHHDQDVRTLVQLYTLIGEKIIGSASHITTEEHEAAAHWWEGLKEVEKAERRWLAAEQSAARFSPRRRYRMALNKRKQKKLREAAQLLEELRARRSPVPEAMDELAKYYEHTEKNVGEALAVTEEALQLPMSEKMKARLQKRQERLLRKGAVYEQ